MSDESSELASRLLIAVVGIPILLYLIIWAPKWAFALLLAAVGIGTVWEYCSITYGDEHPAGKIVTAALSTGMIAVMYFVPSMKFEALVAASVAVATFFLFSFDDRSRVSHQMASSLTGLLYGGAFVGLLTILHQQPHGSWWIVFTLVVVWMSDTAAYFTGRALGEHPLYPAVSPNKSIEGSIGGFAGSIAGAFLCNWLFVRIAAWPALTTLEILVLAIPGNLLAQTGDLVESVVKRAHEVDDSGSILGGHGGLLDRIDGLMYAAPWFYVCVVWILPALF